MAKKVKIEGVIINNDAKWIYSLFGYSSTCPKDIEDVINSIEAADTDKDLDVTINSGGGDVFAGSEIYTLLKGHQGNVSGTIVGVAASAAGVAGMGCKTLRISPTAQVMIHNVKSGARGDYRDMQHTADFLKGWNKSIANAYQLKTGMEQNKLLGLMNKETWLTAQEALEMKFVDEILFNEGNQLAASAELNNLDGMIPEKVMNKVRELMANGGIPANIDTKSLLNLKGDDQMEFDQIVASLPEEQRTVVLNAVENAKTEASTAATTAADAKHAEEKTQLENKIAGLEAAAAAPLVNEEEALLASADPKLRAMIEKDRAEKATAQAKLQEITNASELAKYTAVAAGFDKLPINAAEFGPILKNMASTDNEGYLKVEALLKAVNNMTEAGAIFATNGTGAAVTGDAMTQLKAKAVAIQKGTAGMTYEKAFAQACIENSALYAQYREEREGNE